MSFGNFVVRRSRTETVRAVEASSGCSFARHTHEEYGIGLINRGAQRSWSGRGTIEAGVGDIITVNPGEVHDGAPIDGMRTWTMLYVQPQTVTAIVADLREEVGADIEFTDPVLPGRMLAHCFTAAYQTLTEDLADCGFIDERLTLLLAGLLQRRQPVVRALPPGLVAAKARIDDNPVASYPLEDLAREAGTSRFQILRGFARLTGMTPHAYILQQRVNLARRLIESGSSLADSASASGFVDQSHLNRTFVRRYGLTPGSHAKALR